jgi:hypothetical protein
LRKNSWTEGDQDISLRFGIQGGIKIEPGVAVPLTLVIDTNRMLRFYNKGSTTTPNPGFPSNRAYFFSTVFEDSVFGFAGIPGSIQGFSWVAKACNATGKPSIAKTADYTCPEINASYVAGWTTIVLNNQNLPIAINHTPNDDNNLTVIKGGNRSGNALDSSLFTVRSAQDFDASMTLGGPSNTTLTGKIFGLGSNLAVGSSKELKFDGYSNMWGLLTLERQL